MTDKVTYASYLDLDRILAAQHPASGAHDELLFIIVHQASELWLKLCLHELTAARECIEADRLRPAFKMLARVARAQQQLIQSWDVLSTMTPHDYSAIRPYLGASSGFQSAQYRMMEFMLGGRDARHVKRHKGNADWAERLESERGRASLYDAAIGLLARRGFTVDAAATERDPTSAYVHNSSVEAAWAAIYRDPQNHWDLYELAEKLVDLEYHFQRWRFGHLKTVERIIGFKRGTGGTPGVPYLEGVLKQAFFPELLSVRTAI
ncbi:tryptophan 2,3-dioxygenase [Erythrobacter dokdonensis]|jgi:tryptophan 2,3-dioxygenase|uniref:Tryptophan 2,3-dioxygenase n=1 Tax=Erythrobacter dokdonensis DSW-74 TaxID=1300349 RepID=A0A1A7BFC4_9SPHN|nr:tryptophan 2,3-dioxygenase family protein [Erythrobacter dokdonensis]MEE4316732.1 tryptophan 2,3-dioxygenase family protein [Erythrobacter sp.]OBV09925.1 Tryptophan 2,3-dioxygenase [Erythrobacter dokdonensis DSW-74]